MLWLHIENTLHGGGVTRLLQWDSNVEIASGLDKSVRSQIAVLCGNRGWTGAESKETLKLKEGDQ